FEKQFKRFRQLPLNSKEFDALCSSFWPSNLTAGDRVFSILKAIGYEGNIDDLWLSVYGIRKPSIIKTLPKKSAGSGRLGSQGRGRTGSVFVINTGQSRKPGSHRDNRGHN